MGSLLSSTTNHDEDWTAEGKQVLITGASSGIGAELARQFAKQGASLALLARSKDALSSVAQECTNDLGSPKAEIFPCDLTNDDDIKRAITSAIESFGRLDVVILNAGRSQGCYFEEIQDLDSINYMLKLNVNGVINSLYYALPAVPKAKSSRIVFISSVSGIVPVPYRTIYCATKHALAGFAGSLRIELKDTYGERDSPVVQVINFPEVKGTKLNTGRMDFGAELPPIEFETGSDVKDVGESCSLLMAEIAKGTREWGHPLKVKILLPLKGLIADFLDDFILKTVKKTHHRPTVQNIE